MFLTSPRTVDQNPLPPEGRRATRGPISIRVLWDLLSGLKRVALPALKAFGKAALPMAREALMTGLATKGSVKDRLKAAGERAVTQKNLVSLAKAGGKAAMARPF